MTQDLAPRMLTLEDFTPHLEAVFTVQCEPREVGLTLQQAYPLKNHAELDRPPFLLVFHSDPMTLLTSGTYEVRTDGFAPAAITLQNILAAPKAAPGHYYQAVFN